MQPTDPSVSPSSPVTSGRQVSDVYFATSEASRKGGGVYRENGGEGFSSYVTHGSTSHLRNSNSRTPIFTLFAGIAFFFLPCIWVEGGYSDDVIVHINNRVTKSENFKMAATLDDGTVLAVKCGVERPDMEISIVW